ncbi:hypothetical protein ACQY0O_001829 [Thecaphora frezii]
MAASRAPAHAAVAVSADADEQRAALVAQLRQAQHHLATALSSLADPASASASAALPTSPSPSTSSSSRRVPLSRLSHPPQPSDTTAEKRIAALEAQNHQLRSALDELQRRYETERQGWVAFKEWWLSAVQKRERRQGAKGLSEKEKRLCRKVGVDVERVEAVARGDGAAAEKDKGERGEVRKERRGDADEEKRERGEQPADSGEKRGDEYEYERQEREPSSSYQVATRSVKEKAAAAAQRNAGEAATTGASTTVAKPAATPRNQAAALQATSQSEGRLRSRLDAVLDPSRQASASTPTRSTGLAHPLNGGESTSEPRPPPLAPASDPASPSSPSSHQPAAIETPSQHRTRILASRAAELASLRTDPYRNKGKGRYAREIPQPGDLPTLNQAYRLDAEQNDGVAHAFVGSERRRDKRKQMHAGECDCCSEYWRNIGRMPARPGEVRRDGKKGGGGGGEPGQQQQQEGEEDEDNADEEDEIQKRKQATSRHRAWGAPEPTPPGYWMIGFPDTQQQTEINREAERMREGKRKRVERDKRFVKRS